MQFFKIYKLHRNCDLLFKKDADLLSKAVQVVHLLLRFEMATKNEDEFAET